MSNVAKGEVGQAAVDRFRADGFLLVEDFFSHEELDRFGPEVDEAVRYRTSNDHRAHAEKNLYEQTFVQCMGLWEDHAAVRPLTFHPKLCASAAALLETDCVRLWQDQALYKEAGARETDAHLDYPFWPVDEPRPVSAYQTPARDLRIRKQIAGLRLRRMCWARERGSVFRCELKCGSMPHRR